MKLASIVVTTMLSTGFALPAHAGAEVNLLGNWSGVVHQGEVHYTRELPVSIEVVRDKDGLVLIDRDRVRGGGRPLPLVEENGVWRARYPSTPAGATELSLRPTANGAALMFNAKNDGPIALTSYAVTLTHDNAAARKFFAARMDASGNPVVDYRYRAPVPRDDGLPVSTASAEGVDATKLEQMVRAVLAEKGQIDQPQTDGIIVLRHGKVILEEYFWGQSAANPHEISSCTKSLTSMLAGMVWDEGKLALDAPIASYFTDRPASRWVKEQYPVRVRNLLSMSSGTDWNDTTATGQPSLDLVASRDIAGFMLERRLLREPGSLYNYDNGLPALGGLLIERVAGEPLATFAERKLFKPLAINNYEWMTTRDHGRPLAAGGFVMRPLDAAKLGQLMLDDGMWQGKRLLSSAWVKQSTTQQTTKGDYPYGFYWHLTNAERRHVDNLDGYLAIGQGGQFITVLPQAGLVIVITSSTWKSSPLSRAGGTPLGLINQFIVPAVKATSPSAY